MIYGGNVLYKRYEDDFAELILLIFLEMLLSYPAGRACPVFRDVFERCARSDSVFRVSFCRIIDVSADNA